MEIKTQELENLLNARKIHQEQNPEKPQFSFTGSKSDIEAACTIVLRDNFTSIKFYIN